MTDLNKFLDEVEQRLVSIEPIEVNIMSGNWQNSVSTFQAHAPDDLKTPLALVKKQREALEYYSDPSTWSITEGYTLRTCSDDDTESVDEATPWGAKETRMAGKNARTCIADCDRIAKGDV